MDLYQIRYFLTIAETGNFSRAAERLYLSQPSLSTGIKKLEQELGVTLFERGGRRTVLTPAGRSFLKNATAIMAEYQASLRTLKGFHDKPTLRIGVLSSMRVVALANVMSRFQAQYPHLTIELQDHPLEDLREGLEGGELDVAIAVVQLSCNDEALTYGSEKTSVALFQQPLMLAVPTDHPFAQRTSVRLDDLNDQLFIDRVQCEFFQQECQILQATKVKPKVVYRASHEEWVITLIQSGLGMSIMPYWKGLPGVVYLPIVDLTCHRTLGLQWRQHQDLEWVDKFCHFAKSHDWEGEEH